MIKIFIASSDEAKEYAKSIANILITFEDVEVCKWWQPGSFISGRMTLDEILRASHECDAGVFILGHDDFTCKIPANTENFDFSCLKYAPRDNVLVEAGVFLGLHGKDNVCICALDDVKIPTDFSGIKRVIYDEEKMYIVKSDLYIWVQSIKQKKGKFIFADTHKMDNVPPVFISNKKFVENRLSLKEREEGARELRIVNYAGTSFLTNDIVSKLYDKSWSDWFQSALNGGVNINLVITKAYTAAAEDAAKNKMYPPHGSELDRHEIIPANRREIQSILKDKNKYKNFNLIAKETDIALPYALFETIFEDDSKNHIKVDLYSPLTQNDDNRPSFMVYKSENPDLYKHFAGVIDSIIYQADTIR